MITTIICIIIFVALVGLIGFQIDRDPENSIIIVSFILIAILPTLWYGFCRIEGVYHNYRTGSQIGYITNVHKSGLIFNTMEAEMQPGAGLHRVVAKPFKFTIKDAKMFLEINKCKDLNRLVRVDYEEWFVGPYWKTESGRFLTAIKTIN